MCSFVWVQQNHVQLIIVISAAYYTHWPLQACCKLIRAEWLHPALHVCRSAAMRIHNHVLRNRHIVYLKAMFAVQRRSCAYVSANCPESLDRPVR